MRTCVRARVPRRGSACPAGLDRISIWRSIREKNLRVTQDMRAWIDALEVIP